MAFRLTCPRHKEKEFEERFLPTVEKCLQALSLRSRPLKPGGLGQCRKCGAYLRPYLNTRGGSNTYFEIQSVELGNDDDNYRWFGLLLLNEDGEAAYTYVYFITPWTGTRKRQYGQHPPILSRDDKDRVDKALKTALRRIEKESKS